MFCQKAVNYWYKNYREGRHIKNTVSQILRYGVSLEIIKDNPMAKETLPRPLPKRDNKDNFYSGKELSYFLGCLDDLGDLRYISFFHYIKEQTYLFVKLCGLNINRKKPKIIVVSHC